MSLRFLAGFVVLYLIVGPASQGAERAGRTRYMPPVVRHGMAFPVARSTWYSVINFKDDWHAPRMRLIDGRWRRVGVHEGNDIFAEPGTPVRSVTAGVIEQTGWTFYSGWRVGIRGDDGRYWFYAHLRRYVAGLRVGSRVQPGTPIGFVGNTGYGNRPGHSNEFIYHLHIGIQEPNGVWINPYPIMRRLYHRAIALKR
jgi:murein DD-endopeptidase MepM/ murein hydrolase activator NlpD